MPKSSTWSPAAATVVRPQDYAESPIHYAVAIGDHATLNKLISSLPKLSDPKLICTESESLDQVRLEEQVSAAIDRRDNPLGETPLHLAVRLNDAVAARILAAAGAQIYIQNADGWNPLQEAQLRRCRAVVSALVEHRCLAVSSMGLRRRPRLLEATHRLRDFYTEISFHFESSVLPFVGKIAPSDTFKIWKRGANVRVDTTISGFDGLKTKRANESYLFINDSEYTPHGRCLVILNHDSKKFDILDSEGAPMSDTGTASLCDRTRVIRPGIDVTKVELIGRTNWRGQEKTENVGEWKARVYDMHNVIFTSRSRTFVGEKTEESVTPSRRSVAPCTFDRLVTPPQIKDEEFTKIIRPTVWLTEQFPLKTEELLPFLDIYASKMKPVRRMREVLTTTFPPGTFPVKVAVPLVASVRVVITIRKFVELQRTEDKSSNGDEDKSSNGDKSRYFSWLRTGSRHKQSSSGGEEAVDLFAIPNGYERSTMKMSKSTRKTVGYTGITKFDFNFKYGGLDGGKNVDGGKLGR
ncbi:hypothetical protein DH2020_008892 [Rehmannia glutinosa]|uniref:Ankyrin repeat domain-containing protein n=1 Tax=Rehmannia glutinosa TaxID=99300 RepID=A0ABR0X5C5_REHGL